MDIAELDRDAAVRQDTGPVHAQRWLFRIIDRDHRSIKLAAHTHTAAQPTGKCRAGSPSRAAHTSSGTSISTKNRFSGTVRPSALEGAKLGVYQATLQGFDVRYVEADTEFARYALGSSAEQDRKSTRLNSSHERRSRMPSSA